VRAKSRWIVHARSEFTASHALMSYNGRPEEPHSHLWAVAIRIGVSELNDEGYALDFHEVRGALESVLAPLAGADLNRHAEVGHPSPTAERLAEAVAAWLEAPLAELGGTLLTVSVWEGPQNRVDLELE